MQKTLRPVSLAVLTLIAGIALDAAAQETRRTYIVQLPAAAVSSYEGDIPGLPATKPAPGTRLDITATDVQNYIAYLTQKQNDVLAGIDPANIVARYDTALNGFAVNLTDSEVLAMKKNNAVLNIEAETISQPHTSNTPAFLGLDQPGGLWSKVGGKGSAGEGIIIAHIDSGVWPEDLSFADRVDANGIPTNDPSGTLAYGPPPAKWRNYPHTGVDNLPNGCELKAGITASNCNNKLIGIRSFVDSTSPINSADFLSGRDGTAQGGGGHGSHTLSTAGGNANVPVSINGIDIGFLSGMAPRARVAMYKVCFTGTTSTNGGCASTATLAAVNQAIKDGVDVINYSIGPTAGGGRMNDSTATAFLNATNAGIFVAASAGNSGPNINPAANLGPWNATVAASTHNRTVGANVIEGDGITYRGTSLSQVALPSATIIDAINAGVVAYGALTPQDQWARRLCFSASDRANTTFFPAPTFPAGTTASGAAALDASLVAGKIVICDRGSSGRLDKSVVVANAGGIGMVMADNGVGLAADAHVIPTVHISQGNGASLKAYVAATAAPTAALTKAMVFLDTPAPFVAGFSSRGPNVADENLLKPDLSAPGVDIAAAYAPTVTSGELANIKNNLGATSRAAGFLSGTSMASPHIAGIAALLKQQHPTWTPSMIKSAMMTSAGDTLEDGVTSALGWTAGAIAAGRLPFAQGAGQVNPNGATDPGLVYAAAAIDYARLSCGFTAPNAPQYSAATCASIGSIKGSALNQASITAANVLGSTTISRTVTNVGGAPATYNSSVVMDGFSAVVTPASFTIAAGATQTFTIKLTRTTAPSNTWAFGNLIWDDGNGHRVRSPISARGPSFAVNPLVTSEATSGSKITTVGTGFGGPMTIDKGGLKAATRSSAMNFTDVNQGTAATICAANNSAGVKVSNFAVPAGTMVARFSLYDADTGAAAFAGAKDDFDLLILNSANVTVGSSLNAGSNESVTLINPAADTYKACVVLYDKQARTSSSAILSSWIVSPTDTGGAFKVLAPANAILGGTMSVGLSWSGLPVGQRYLAALNYKNGGAVAASTIVDIQTNNPVPLAFNSKVTEAAAD